MAFPAEIAVSEAFTVWEYIVSFPTLTSSFTFFTTFSVVFSAFDVSYMFPSNKDFTFTFIGTVFVSANLFTVIVTVVPSSITFPTSIFSCYFSYSLYYVYNSY